MIKVKVNPTDKWIAKSDRNSNGVTTLWLCQTA